MKQLGVMLAACAAGGMLWAAPRHAGNLLVDLDASTLAAAAGDTVATWPNAGTMGDFKAFGTGPTYAVRDGVSVVRFDGSAANCMTNCVAGEVPSVLLGNNPWTMEAWVFCEQLTGTHTYLSWTARGTSGTVCEFRYTNGGVDNAVEHYGADYNMKWGSELPAVGEWHHFVCVRQANGVERLYCDGRMVWINYNTLNLSNDGPVMLGGVYDRSNYATPTMLFAGDLARVRVTDAALAPADVYANYLDACAAFGRTAEGLDAVWNGAWVEDVAPAAGRGLAILGGDVTLTDFAGSVPYFRQTGGKVTFAGQTDLSVPQRLATDYPYLQDEAGQSAELVLAGGTLRFNNTFFLGLTGPGATTKLTVGGTDEPALLSTSVETCIGHNKPGTTTEINVLANGTIHNDNGWLRFGSGSGTTANVTIEQGGFVDAAQLLVGGWGSSSRARVAGTVQVRNAYMGIGEGSDTELILEPTGRLRARGFREWNNTSTWSGFSGVSHLHVNAGTLELYPVEAYGTGTPFLDTVMRVTYENSIVFDIPTGGTTVVNTNPEDVTEGGQGRIVKKGGGMLSWGAEAVAGLRGVIDIEEGSIRFLGKFSAGQDVLINVAEGAKVSCDVQGGGAADLLKFISPDSRGALMLHGNDGTQIIDLSSHPNMIIALNAVAFQGSITPAGDEYVFDTMGLDSALVCNFSGSRPLRFIDSVGNGRVHLRGDNSGMTGGITVEGGTVLFAHSFAAGSSGPVHLAEGTGFGFEAALGVNFITSRVTADSRPSQLFILAGGESVNADLSRFPGCRLGTVGQVSITQAGSVTPNGSEYLLGGGGTQHASSDHGLMPGVLADGAAGPTTVVVDRDGMIDLSRRENSYSGGTVVTNGARVFTTADGYGAVPAAFDATNIFVDGGILRTGNTSFSVDANRGVWIGEQGAIFHPWGSFTCDYQGGLGGSGTITVTDGGHLTFSGAHNTYSGRINLNNASTIFTIGGDTAFSWDSTGGIAGAGNVVLKTPTDATFNDVVSTSGSLTKEGAGTMTLTAEQTLPGSVVVSEGTLRLTGTAAIKKASGIRNDGTIVVDRGGTVSDVFGATPFYGTGSIGFTADGTEMTIDRGLNGATLAAKNGGRLDYSVMGTDGGSLVDVDAATLAVSPTGATDPVSSNFYDFQVNGSAEVLAANDLLLTRAEGSQAGSAFWKERISVTRPWEARFSYGIENCPASPADGFAFVVQASGNGPAAVGASGGSIGALGVTPLVGAAFNVYNDDSFGWIYDNGKKEMATDGNYKTFVQDGLDVIVSYDGQGKLRLTVFSRKDTTKSYTKTLIMNLYEKLGSATAYVGLTGGTGGLMCEQHVRDFSFRQDTDPQPDLTLAEDGWQFVGHAQYASVNGGRSVQLTDTASYQTGVVTRLERVYLGRPFRVSGTYLLDNWTQGPADGAAFFLHNDRPTAHGAAGGSMGVVGTGGHGNLPSAIGFGLNVYNTASLKLLKNAGWGTNTPIQGVNPKDKTPVAFEFAYTADKDLVMTLRQNANVFAVTQRVDLCEYFGRNWAWFAVSAATGGSNGRQYVYDLELTGEAAAQAGYAGATFTGASTLELARVAAGMERTELGEAVFADGAALTLRASGATDLPYTVTLDTVRITPGTRPSVVTLAPNGSAAGTLRFNKIAADPSGRALKIEGAAAPITGRKIQVELPLFKGLVKVLDLTAATGLALEDFELVTPTKQPVELRLVNGILYAIHSTGSVLFFR